MSATKSHARRLGFRLFLEGVEVDMINCTIRGGINSPAIASISIPSNDKAHEIKPRTLVHIFFYENRYELGTKENRTVDNHGQPVYGNDRPIKLEDRISAKKSGTASKLHDYNDIMNWKLIYTGEVVGYGFSKIGGLRSINLSCTDFSSYWNLAQMYWGYPGASNDSKKRAIFVGATRLYQGASTRVTTRDRLVKVLTAKPNGQLQPEGILGGLVSLLESASGVFSPGEGGRAHRGVNDMLSFAELRLHLTRTIAASDKDKTASIFMEDAIFKKWLYRIGKSVKQTASYLQLVSSILPHIHYEWSSLPAPPFMPASDTGLIATEIKTIPTQYSGSGDIPDFIARCRKTWNAVNTLESKTLRSTSHRSGMPWGYDFMSHQPGTDAEGNQSKNDDTTQFCESGWNGTGHIGSLNALLAKGAQIRTSMYEKSKGQSKVKRRADQIYKAYTKAEEACNILRKLKAGSINRTSDKFFDVKYLLEQAMNLASGGLVKPTRIEETLIGANSRLHMFMFKPDLYMSPPPKCNVLFPDMIQSIMYSRNWMSEISRLWLFTRRTSGRGRQDLYFAPNTSILGHSDPDEPSAAEEAVRNRESFHMNHEKFTGIIPEFIGVSDWKALKKAYKQQLSEGGEAGEETNAHLVRAANFLFFKARYGTRNMKVTCRFSPQLIPGLPAMILDPDEGADRFQLVKSDETLPGDFAAEQKSTGVHYFGVIHSVEHVANASGGAQTKVVLTHCRTHTEAADIYGGEDATSWIYKTVTAKELKGNDLKAEVMADHGGADVYHDDWKTILGTDYKSNATYVAEVQKESDGTNVYTTFEHGYVSATGLSADEHPRRELGKSETYVGPGSVNDAEDNWWMIQPQGPQFSDLLESDNYVDTYKVPALKLKVWEVTKSRAPKKINFTFESIVTPPWYSGCFLPHKIGQEFYDKMLGCRSVVDDPPITLNDKAMKEHEELLADESKDSTLVEIFKKYPMQKGNMIGGKGEYKVMVPAELLKKTNSATWAAEHLAEAWLGMKKLDADINQFIDTYVDRSYATMFDIFGNTNEEAYGGMELGTKGSYSGAGQAPDHEGFHGQAFGMKTGLDGLDEAAKERLPRSDTTSKEREGVNPAIDTRLSKYQAVKEYKGRILRSPTGKGSA